MRAPVQELAFLTALCHIIHHFSVQTLPISVNVTDGTVRCSCSYTIKPYFIASKCQKEIYTSDLKNVPTEDPGGGTSFAWLGSKGDELQIASVFIVPQSGCTSIKLGSLANFKRWIYCFTASVLQYNIHDTQASGRRSPNFQGNSVQFNTHFFSIQIHKS